MMEQKKKPSISIRTEEEKHQLKLIKNLYCKLNMTFEIFISGSITKFVFSDGKTRRYGSVVPKEGLFLSKLTRRVVKERLESGMYVPKNTDPYRNNSNTIMYSSDRIRENLFKTCAEIDIISCYWQSSFNLGIIDEETYLKGIKKDREYKDGRNIAIGSLGSLTLHEKYVNGKLIKKEAVRNFGACARLDIVDHVWKIAQKIGKKLGPDFLMFLTDCFFVPEHRKDDVIKYLATEGYKSKASLCEFGKVEKMSSGKDKNEHYFTEKVVWFDVEKNKIKFHDFNYTHNRNF